MKKNKIYSMILSVMVAFGLWLYVVNNVSSEMDATFNNIPVVREGESVLKERNLMVTNISHEVVSLNLFGSRDDLNKVDSSNTSVKIDLSNIQEPGEKIPLTYVPSFPLEIAWEHWMSWKSILRRSMSVLTIGAPLRCRSR